MISPLSSKLALWLLLVLATIVAAEVGPRSTTLASVLTDIESQIPACAFQCFSSFAGSKNCDYVEEFINTDVTHCLYANCTTHQLLKAEQVITTTCGTEVRDIQPGIRGVTWTLWGVATIFLAGRLLSRSSWFSGMQLGWDDWAIIASYVVLTAVSIGAELMVVFGLGKDMWTLEDTNITIVLILFYIAEFAYVIESTITKVSILLLYLRIFPDRQFRKYVYALMIVMGLFCVAFVVTLLTYCVPFDYTWMRWDNQNTGTCINMNAQTYTCAALNIVLDLLIFFLPIPQLFKLDLSMKKKIGIIFTFLVGLFVTVCSMIRLKALIGWQTSTNPTMEYANLAVWSLVELDVGVICACMPGMAGLFRRMKKRGTEYMRSKSSNNGSQAFGSQAFGGTNKGTGQAITKTTIISVKRTQCDDQTSDSELELVDRSKGSYNYRGHYPHESQGHLV
ncbi:hypothetical protein JX265_005824 [Neoarthrinium moseri]|uniref:Rhodopsin domain-containing protein n=1 Tax=Neoarthrinium moseri TaxID=1658444 RepID=A0A9P9WNT3_9PEZI|nr:uncharacterized protein JN550_011641 [Neoarthrinium moseri]KAI1860263.1 hypothetical protein JN550_011641 [Neoarthrinium moseri]KAI1871838.1 hypothetical protein JX265_005824 [Neoarthrinium moseri]